MKTSILLVAAIIFSSSISCAQWGNKKIKGDGNMTTETRNTSDYEKVKCAGSLDYVLVRGVEGKITLKGEKNLLDYISVEVKKNSLIIKTENNVYLKPSNGNKIVITIPFKDIDGASLAGSGDMYTKDAINADEFEAALAGSGDLSLTVNAKSLQGKLAGSGDLTLTGETNNFEAKVAGSGDIHAYNLKANDVDVAVAGSGDAEVTCNGTLRARITGSGDVEYKGNPTSEDTKVAGSGSVSYNN